MSEGKLSTLQKQILTLALQGHAHRGTQHGFTLGQWISGTRRRTHHPVTRVCDVHYPELLSMIWGWPLAPLRYDRSDRTWFVAAEVGGKAVYNSGRASLSRTLTRLGTRGLIVWPRDMPSPGGYQQAYGVGISLTPEGWTIAETVNGISAR